MKSKGTITPHVTGTQDGGFIWFGAFRKAAFGYCALTNYPGDIHRRAYTLADAEAIAEWLREREAGYPPHEALMAGAGRAP